ncbi:MAG TPA: triose-phosphate isomerase [Cyclobacteriaceae bacterium]|nr:triose-phosphate isomerase [Cyclobacteriaceae bacterium]
MRKKIVAGNWKMNKTLDEALALASEIAEMAKDEVRSNATAVLCTPFPYLVPVLRVLGDGSSISVGAQNCSAHEWGAYTGETSALMLASLKARYVIIGHSERRQYFGEDGPLLAAKVDITLRAGLTPIFCCGEPLEVREKGGHQDLVGEQIAAGLFHLGDAQIRKVVIAYEPVWAIGTGKTATPDQAQEMHAFIRSQLAKKYGDATASEISILYGGSVNASNARELFSNADVDGGLVGGASLKSRDFVEIIKAAG